MVRFFERGSGFFRFLLVCSLACSASCASETASISDEADADVSPECAAVVDTLGRCVTGFTCGEKDDPVPPEAFCPDGEAVPVFGKTLECAKDYVCCAPVQQPAPGFCKDQSVTPFFDKQGLCIVTYGCCDAIDFPGEDFCDPGWWAVPVFDDDGECIVDFACEPPPADPMIVPPDPGVLGMFIRFFKWFYSQGYGLTQSKSVR